jgi:hypothetical protein
MSVITEQRLAEAAKIGTTEAKGGVVEATRSGRVPRKTSKTLALTEDDMD